MAQKTIKAHMKQRRDTKANWESINPVLLDGELGIVSDDPNLYKVGNGSNAWNDLPFRGFDGTLVHHTGTSATAVMSQKAVTESLTALQESVTEKTQELMRKKADQDGKYPELTAGFANNLVGRGEAVDATINFRPSGGTSIEDGAARVKELKGNSLVWNQIFANYRAQNATLSENGSLITITPTGSYPGIKCDGILVVGHRYICLTERVGGGDINLNAGGYNAPLSKFFAASDSNAVEIIIFTFNQTETYTITKPIVCDLTQMFGSGNEPTSVEEFYNRIPQNVDLYAYNEGEVIHTNAEGIKSVGFNAWDEEWEQGMYDSANGNKIPNDSTIRNKNKIKVIEGQQYYFKSGWCQVFFYDMNNSFTGSTETGENGGLISIPQNARYMAFRTSSNYGMAYKNDICINLAHSGYRNGEYQPYMQFIRDIDPRIREAFPNGMRSAGTASDKVYNKNGKGYIEKRIGVVDLGSLNWAYIAPVMGASVPNIFRPTTYAERIDGLLCENYIVDTKIALDDSATNKSIKREGGSVYIKDTAYTDAATFKAAMSGVMLYYELAEPEILEFDEPFNLDYEVWDFGTEQMIATEPSAPIKASIVYGFNAVDSVRTAQLEIAELKTQIAQMQAIMASMTAQPAALTE